MGFHQPGILVKPSPESTFVSENNILLQEAQCWLLSRVLLTEYRQVLVNKLLNIN